MDESMRRNKGLSFYRRKKKISASTLREIFVYIFGICLAVFLAFILVYSVGMSISVIGESMEPELHNGQKVLVNRYAYLLTSPKAGDIIAFLPNGNKSSHYYIKRVVAVAGDTVEIKDGRLYVNGNKVTEEYDKMAEAGIAENPLTLASGEYFVLGDNRNASEDSRSANIGPVKSKDIIGKVWFKR
ncbi:MAG: signal peptidase I [Lachnospiraceae bacterium]